MTLFYKTMPCPVGEPKLISSDKGLVAILWENDPPRRVRLGKLTERPQHLVLVETERQLGEYFAGRRKDFTIPLDMRGTRFQNDVWRGSVSDPVWRNQKLRAARLATGKPARGPGRRRSQWQKSRFHRRALPSCHRFVGQAHRLRRRPRSEGPSARSRKEGIRISAQPGNAGRRLSLWINPGSIVMQISSRKT